jgi:hypothetical protein
MGLLRKRRDGEEKYAKRCDVLSGGSAADKGCEDLVHGCSWFTPILSCDAFGQNEFTRDRGSVEIDVRNSRPDWDPSIRRHEEWEKPVRKSEEGVVLGKNRRLLGQKLGKIRGLCLLIGK